MNEIQSQVLDSTLRAFARIEWPLSRDSFRNVASGLHWILLSDRRMGMSFDARLGLNVSRADILVSDECVGSVSLRLTDTFEESVEGLARAFWGLTEKISELMGSDPAGSESTDRRHWELSSGGRLVIRDTGRAISLQLLSEKFANIEREEYRQQLDPRRH